MAPRVFTSVPEIEAAVGQDLGTTSPVRITQDLVNRFADVTGDQQWIHVDVARAAASSMGGTIAHGYLTLSMIPAFAQQLFALEAGSARLNYGLEKVRFPAPVPVGSSIHGSALIKDVQTVPAGTRVAVAWTVEIAGGTRPVCVAESITLVVP
jgi:acyl dehydratase